MNRRIAIKILRRAGENLAGVAWPRETYCPPFALIDRAVARLWSDTEHGEMVSAWAFRRVMIITFDEAMAFDAGEGG